MEAPSRLRWTYGGVVILCVTMAPAVQSCAVMSSTSDCASKADCPVDDASGATSSSSSGNIGSSSSGGTGSSSGGPGSSSGGSEGGPATGDDGGDATVADVSSEATPLDAPGDAIDGTLADVVGDVTSEDSTTRDVVSEPPVDAARDVAAEATGDGCTATVEDCTNGVDDSCDGKIDCADPACSSFTCVAQVPAGWTGPALLWLGGATATAPACPTGYQPALDGHEGPTGVADGCTCICSAGGQVCSATGNFHNDQGCAENPACVTGTVSSASSACINLAANICGTGGSFEVNGGGALAPTAGACTPQTTTTPGPAAGWTTTARVCAWAGANDTPGGCSPTTDQCVGGSPGATAGFTATACVFQSGAVACPAAYPNNRNVVFSAESDTRSCAGCACATATPTGGSCAGSVNLYGAANCGGAAITYPLGTPCLVYNGIGAVAPAGVVSALTVTPGSCAVGTQPSPTGTVTGTGPTTVCCM